MRIRKADWNAASIFLPGQSYVKLSELGWSSKVIAESANSKRRVLDSMRMRRDDRKAVVNQYASNPDINRPVPKRRARSKINECIITDR